MAKPVFLTSIGIAIDVFDIDGWLYGKSGERPDGVYSKRGKIRVR